MKKKIEKIAQELMSEAGYFAVQYDGVTYITGLDFINNFLQRYHLFTLYWWNTSLEAVDAFKDLWIMFLATSEDEIKHIIQTITAEYDVTEDYFRTISTASKNTHMTTYGKTETETPNNYTTTTTYGGRRSDSVTTFDSTAYRPEAEGGNSGSDTVTTTGSISKTTGGSDTITDTRLAADNVVTESGRNATPTETVDKEIAMRIKYDLCNIITQRFASLCVFLEA